MSAAHQPVALLDIEPASYVVHAVHGPGRSYPETNCYADVLIELLHARGLEPLAVLGCALRADFEGDQWTFVKPAPGDLEPLLGVDVHEMQPYRSLPHQLAEQLGRDRTVVVELDAFHLPDTAATSYGREHVKTSVIPVAIDPEGRFLRYFHNAGLYDLDGADFAGLFRLDGPADPAVLPPYLELVRFDAGTPLEGDALREGARERTAWQLARRPADNPFDRFGAQLEVELPALLAGDAESYHAYAFATVRMFGAAFELAADHVEWLLGADAAEPAAALRTIVEGAKVLSFRLARRRPFDPGERVAELGAAWAQAMEHLDRALR